MHEGKEKEVQRRRSHLWAWISAAALLALIATDAEAGRRLRDFSGDAMQRYDSRMMSSPVMRFPGLLKVSLWPYMIYPPAPSLTIVNVHVHNPYFDEPRPAVVRPAARPKFWTVQCGVFVEFEVSSTMNLMEEERKRCSP
jgi:hypothetical protein